MRPALMGSNLPCDTCGANRGTWTLAERMSMAPALLNLPLEMDWLSSSERRAIVTQPISFDDAVFDGADGGTWSIAFREPWRQIPRLSHMSFYVRIDEERRIPLRIQGSPRLYAMMLAGLSSVGLMARRQKPRFCLTLAVISAKRPPVGGRFCWCAQFNDVNARPDSGRPTTGPRKHQ